MGLFMCLTELCGCGDEIDVEKELLDAIEESMKECIRSRPVRMRARILW